MTPAEYRQLIRTVRNGPYQLGIRIDGKLREVYEFASKSDRERFILSITPPRVPAKSLKHWTPSTDYRRKSQ